MSRKNPVHKPPFKTWDYIKALIYAVVITLAAAGLQYWINVDNPRPPLHLWSNAFLASGGILLAGGVMSWVMLEGFFDGAIVGFKQIGQAIRPSEIGSVVDYSEYSAKKRDERRVNIPFLIFGAICLLISIGLAVI